MNGHWTDRRYNRLALGFLLLGAFACADGGGDAGCGCGSGGGEGGAAYEFPADGPIIQQAAQIHVTGSGLDFLAANAVPLVEEAIGPDGLSFCLESQDVTVAEICNNSRCDDGTRGCQLDIGLANIEVVPNASAGSDYLRIDLGIVLNETLDFDLLLNSCTAALTSPADGIPVSANIYFDVDAPPGEKVHIAFPSDELSLGIDAVGIDIDGVEWYDVIPCEAVDLLSGPLVGILEDQIAGPLEDALGPALCTQCEVTEDCPIGSTCNGDGVCIADGTDECLPLDLGLETQFDVGELLADFAPGLEAQLGVLVYVANYADMNGPDRSPAYGIDLAAQMGFEADANRCVPYQAPPTIGRIGKSSSINTDRTPAGDEFMLGIGVARQALDLALWGVYRSGALCLTIGTETVDLISSQLFSALLPSLGDLTEGENRPMGLTLRPQQAPTIELGEGTVTYEDDGTPVIDDPLLTLRLERLFIDAYTYVDERQVRVFTLDVDAAVPLGLDVNADGQIIVVLGDLTEAFTRVEARDGELLSQSDLDSLGTALPALIGSFLPLLGDELIPPIDLPEFVGLRIDLPAGAFTSVDDNSMLAIFGNLAPGTGGEGELNLALMPEVLAATVELPDAAVLERLRDRDAAVDAMDLVPTVDIELSTLLPALDTPGVEYSYRINGGLWSFWHRGDVLRLQDPRLLLQGEHRVEVRAREIDRPATVSPWVAATTVVVDYEGPTVELEVDGADVHVLLDDLVAATDDLSARWTVDGTTWAAVDGVADTLDLSAFAGQSVNLTIEATDGVGNRTVETRTLALGGSTASIDERTVTPAEAIDREPRAGCAAAGGSSGAGALWLVFGAALFGLRRRRSAGLVLAVAAAFALTLGGCGSDKSAGGTADPNACDPECEGGLVCDNGACVECAGDEDCEAGICVDNLCVDDGCATDDDCGEGEVCDEGACVEDTGCALDEDCPEGSICDAGECLEVECIDASDCPACPDGGTAICDGNECACAPACDGACGEGQGCCWADDTCVDIVAVCPPEDCEVGFGPAPDGDPVFDNETCETTTPCSCQELPPLDPGSIGRHLDIGVSPDGSTTLVAAYNATYGDLMIGEIAGDGSIEWAWVDGAPSEGAVTGSLNGPRGGISTAGDDVGRYPSIELTDDGTAWVAYRSDARDEEGLRFAVGSRDGDGWTWSIIPVVDGAAEAGLYNDMFIGADGLPGVVYMVPAVANEDATLSSQLRVVFATSATPGSAEDFSAPVVLDDAINPTPCAGACVGRQQCRADTNTCVIPERASRCDPECADGEACFENEDASLVCASAVESSDLDDLVNGIGLFADAEVFDDGRIAVAYYDRIYGNLRYLEAAADGSGAAVVIVDGEMMGEEGVVDTGDVGWFPDVLITGGNVWISYVNASTGELYAFNRDADTIEVVDDGFRCFEFVDGECVSMVISRVGDDSSLIETGDGVVLQYQDATQHDLLEVGRNAVGWDFPPSTVAGREDPYDGAFGFWLQQGEDADGRFVVTHRIHNRAEPPVRDVVVFRR